MAVLFGQANEKSRADADLNNEYRPFFAALFDYVKRGNCNSNAVAFAVFADKSPGNEYAGDALDISAHLTILNQQNQKWKEPSDWKTLPLDGQIDYHIHHLQDMNFVQGAWPDECNVVQYSDEAGTNSTYMPALELKKIGLPAASRLIQLLTDRRPTRCVGFRRPWFRDSWTLLRYQDAAIQILESISGEGLYCRNSSSSYLSRETDKHRNNIIKTAQQWYRKRTGAEPLDPPSVTFPHVNPTVMKLLSHSQRQLAFESIVLWQKYFLNTCTYTERCTAPVGHVVVCPQANDTPPMFAVFRGAEGVTEGMFSLVTAHGSFVNVFNGYNILSPPGTIIDVNGDGIVDLLTVVSCCVSTNSDISTSLFWVIPITPDQEPILAVAYNRGEASNGTFHLSPKRENGSYDIEIRKREAGIWRTLATYTWSSGNNTYEGPKGSPDSDIWMFDHDPGDEIIRYIGPSK